MKKAYSTQSLSKFENLFKKLDKDSYRLLNESNEVEKEYKSEVSSLNTNKN